MRLPTIPLLFLALTTALPIPAEEPPAAPATALGLVPLGGVEAKVISVQAVLTPPDHVTLSYTIVNEGARGTLRLGLPDRAGPQGNTVLEPDVRLNGAPVEVRREPAGVYPTLAAVPFDTVVGFEVPLEEQEFKVVTANFRLGGTWLGDLVPGEVAHWLVATRGPVFQPFYRFRLDLSPSAVWRPSVDEVRVRVPVKQRPLLHAVAVQPGGWIAKDSEITWKIHDFRWKTPFEVLVPALDTEDLLFQGPGEVRAWQDATRDGTWDPEEIKVFASALEAKHGKAFEGAAGMEFTGRPWYKPDKAYAESRLTAGEREARGELLRIARAPGAPAPAPAPPPVLVAEKAPPPPPAPPAPVKPAEPVKPEPKKPEPKKPEPKPAEPAPAPPPAPVVAAGQYPETEAQAKSWIEDARKRGATPREIKIARNFYFARHGRTFTTPWLQEHFASQPWYKPATPPGDLTAEEKKIVAALAAYEKETPAKAVKPPAPAVAASVPPPPGGPIAPVVAAPAPAPASPPAPAPAPKPAPAPTPAPAPAFPDLLQKAEEIPASEAQAKAWIEEAKKRGASRREVQAMRNAVYARYGRVFTTPWLQRFYELRPWYKADPGFKDSRLTAGDAAAVKALLAYETTLPAR